MRCAECGCVDHRAKGWIALLGRDPDDIEAPAEMCAYCPVCAAREFKLGEKTAQDYV